MRFGYHVKITGGFAASIANGEAAGCDTIQIFPGSPQMWGPRLTTDEQIEAFRDAKAGSEIDPVLIHAIYLVNMAAPDDGIYKRSVSSLTTTLTKAHKLGCRGVITHIGNHKGEGEEFGIARIAEAVGTALENSEGDAMLLLETTAGAGTSIGHTFEQFGTVFDMTGRPDRLGFCLDTCHIFAAGYDISTAAGIDSALAELDEFIGLDRLEALHLNDSKGECGSRLDRHEHIGYGQIGLDAFRYIVRHPVLNKVPSIIELPYGPDLPDDIALLRSFQE